MKSVMFRNVVAMFRNVKDLQNEEIISKNGYAKSGFIMFSDDYEGDDSMICCRLWKREDKTGTVLDNGRYKGSLAKVFQNVLNFIERNTRTGWRKQNLVDEKRFEHILKKQ